MPSFYVTARVTAALVELQKSLLHKQLQLEATVGIGLNSPPLHSQYA